MPRILIVEDHADLSDLLAEHLQARGHQVSQAASAAMALTALQHQPVDLVVLDLMLPDKPGESVLRSLRANGVKAPVLILSARSDESTKVLGFGIGADDYLTKPFGLLELLARVDNLLRRRVAPPDPDSVRFGNVEVRPAARQVFVSGREVPLRPKEMDLLIAMVANANRAVSRRALLEQVWRYDTSVESRTVDWHMAELRRKLEPDPDHPRFLQTVRKVGYRLDLEQVA